MCHKPPPEDVFFVVAVDVGRVVAVGVLVGDVAPLTGFEVFVDEASADGAGSMMRSSAGAWVGVGFTSGSRTNALAEVVGVGAAMMGSEFVGPDEFAKTRYAMNPPMTNVAMAPPAIAVRFCLRAGGGSAFVSPLPMGVKPDCEAEMVPGIDAISGRIGGIKPELELVNTDLTFTPEIEVIPTRPLVGPGILTGPVSVNSGIPSTCASSVIAVVADWNRSSLLDAVALKNHSSNAGGRVTP